MSILPAPRQIRTHFAKLRFCTQIHLIESLIKLITFINLCILHSFLRTVQQMRVRLKNIYYSDKSKWQTTTKLKIFTELLGVGHCMRPDHLVNMIFFRPFKQPINSRLFRDYS